MAKLLMVLLAIFSIFMAVCVARAENVYDANWNGLNDTANINDTLKANAVRYTKAFRLSAFEDCRAIFKINTLNAGGLGTDSTFCRWGYQTFSLTYDSAGNTDTAFDERVILDTCSVDSFGKVKLGYSAINGALTKYSRDVDTSNITGFACQTRWFVPEWDTYIRFWVLALTGQATLRKANVQFHFLRRNYINVREK